VQGNTLVFPFITEKSHELTANTLIDITHEALIRNWQKLKNWTQQEYQDVQDLKELKIQLNRWLESNKSDEHLLSPGAFQYVHGKHDGKLPSAPWIKRYVSQDQLLVTDGRSTQTMDATEQLSNAELVKQSISIRNNIIDFYDKSKQQIDRAQAQRKRVVVSLTALAIVAILAFVWSFVKKNESDKNEAKAIALAHKIEHTAKANEIATLAFKKIESDPTLAFRLAEASYNIEPTPLNEQVIMESYSKFPFHDVYKHKGVQLVKWSDKRQCLVTFGHGHVQIRNEAGELLQYFKAHSLRATGVWEGIISLSNDGKMIVTTSRDGTAKIWDYNGNCTDSIVHKQKVFTAVVSKDSKKILTCSLDSSLTIWNEGIQKKIQLKDYVKRAVFVNNDKSFAAISNNKIVLGGFNGKDIKEVQFDEDIGLYSIAYSEKFKMIYVCADLSIYVYDLNLKLNKVLNAAKTQIYGLFIDPSGQYLSISSFGNIGLVYDLNNDRAIILKGHRTNIWMSQVDSEAKIILTASDDGTGRVWDLDGNELFVLKRHNGPVYGCVIPKGKSYVYTVGDYLVRKWEIDIELPRHYGGHGGVHLLAASHNGKYMASCVRDGHLYLWSSRGKLLKKFAGFSHYVVNKCGFYGNDSLVYGSSNGSEFIFYNVKEPYNEQYRFNDAWSCYRLQRKSYCTYEFRWG